jgi:hypothetical protein
MNKIYYLVLVIFCLSCAPGKEREVQILELSDLIVDTLFLEKDTLTKNLGPSFTHFQTDSGEVLMTFVKPRLLVYSYPDGRILKSVMFEKEGPDGIGDFIPGSFIDRERIYFLSQDQKLIEADFEGKVIRRIPLPEVPAERLSSNYSTMPFNPIFKSQAGLFIPDVPFVLKESLLSYQNWILDFSIKEGSFSHVSFSFPPSAKNFFDDPELGQYFHLYDPAEKVHWVSFSASDSVLKIEGENRKWIRMAPTEKPQLLKGTTSQAGEWTAFHPNPESGKYTVIQKDQLTGLLTRHAIIQKGSADENIRSKHAFVVVNSVGEKIAEINFSNLDFGTISFSIPEGTYLPIGAQLWEDEVAYIRLDFSRINT